LVERLKELGIETYRIEMRNPFDIKAVFNLVKLCKKLDIDLIHTQFLRENYIAMLSRIINPKVRVMYTNHFIMRNNLPSGLPTELSRLWNPILLLCATGDGT